MIFKGTAIALILALACALAWLWEHPRETIVERERFQTVPIPVEVERIKTVKVPIKEIVVIEKEPALKAANLPNDTLSDKQEIIAVGKVDPNDGKTTIVAIINTDTGKTDLVARQEKPDFFGIPAKKFEIEFGAGYGTEGIVFDGSFRWRMFRTGAWTWISSIDAMVYEDNKANAALMLKASYAFNGGL